MKFGHWTAWNRTRRGFDTLIKSLTLFYGTFQPIFRLIWLIWAYFIYIMCVQFVIIISILLYVKSQSSWVSPFVNLALLQPHLVIKWKFIRLLSIIINFINNLYKNERTSLAKALHPRRTFTQGQTSAVDDPGYIPTVRVFWLSILPDIISSFITISSKNHISQRGTH